MEQLQEQIQKGFALAELMIALAILSFSLPAIFILQSMLLKRAHSAIENKAITVTLQNYITEAHQHEWYNKQEATATQDDGNKNAQKIYLAKKITENSTLKKFAQTLMQEQTQYRTPTETRTVYSYVFVPPKPSAQQEKKREK